MRLRSVALERLEDRTLMSTLPAPTVISQTYNPNQTPPASGSGGNAYTIGNIGSVNTALNGNLSTPSVAIDPQNSQHMVAVWIRDDPAHVLNNGNGGISTTAWIEGAYSVNAGATWTSLSGPIENGEHVVDFSIPPPASGTNFFAQYTDPSVAFDSEAGHNFYITFSVHNATGGAGQLELQKFSFSGAAPAQQISGKVLYQWIGDQAYTPTLAVDSSPPPSTTQLLQSPIGVAYPPSGNPNSNVYVSSQGVNPQLQYNGSTGGFVGSYGTSSLFSQPEYLSFDNSGNLYTADSGKHSVVKTTGGTSTTLVQGDTLSTPSGMAAATDPSLGANYPVLLVVSKGGGSVLEYDGRSGAFIKDFITGLNSPDGLVLDKTNNLLYISTGTTAANSQVLVYQPPTGASPGSFVKAVPNPSTPTPPGPQPFNAPGALALDAAKNLYVANPGNDSISLYKPGTNSTSTAVQGYRLSTPRGEVFNFDPSVGAAGANVLLVASRGSDSILEYDAVSGAFIRAFVLNRGSTGDLIQPDSLTTDTNGNVYVTTQANNLVLRYKNDGTPFPSAGNTGAVYATGHMITPAGLALDPVSGDLFVVSSGSGQVLRFQGPTKASPGAFLSNYAGGLNAPVGLAFGAAVPVTPPTLPTGTNNLYVSNSGTNSVLYFQGTDGSVPGSLLGNFVSPGQGGLTTPQGLTFGSDGNLYVASGTNEILEYFGPTTGGPRAFNQVYESKKLGGMTNPYAVLFDTNANNAAFGDLYVTSQDTNQVLQYRNNPSQFNSNFAAVLDPTGLAVDPTSGNLDVAVGSNGGAQQGMVVQYSAAGKYLQTLVLSMAQSTKVGTVLTAGTINAPKGLAFGPDLELYVSDRNAAGTQSQVTRYKADGTPDPSGSGTAANAVYVASSTLLSGGYDLAFDDAGNLYVSSQNNNKVLQHGGPASATPPPGAATPTTDFAAVFTPYAAVVDTDPASPAFGRLLVTNFTGNMVEEFDPATGAYVGTFIAPNSGLSTPTDLIVDTKAGANLGQVIVSSPGSSNVVRYSTTGALLGTIGVANPAGLALDASDLLYVADITNNQVLRYQLNGTPAPAPGHAGAVFAAAGFGGLFSPRGLAFDPATGDLLVASFNNNEVLRYDTTTGAVAPSPGNPASSAIFINPGDAVYTTTLPGGATFTQSDPYHGNVYVAWGTQNILPTPTPTNPNPNRIAMIVSSDGGTTFSSRTYVDNDLSSINTSVNSEHDSAPQIAISQGRPAGTLGAGDLGVPGGQVTVVWDRSNTGLTTGDEIMATRITNAGTAVTVNGQTGTIQNANLAASGNSIEVDSPFTAFANITNPGFTTLTNLTVTVAINNANVGTLALVLTPPLALQQRGFGPITLLRNSVDLAGQTITPAGQIQGASGPDAGYAVPGTPPRGLIGLTFSDLASRTVRLSTSPAGYYLPETGSLSAFNGLTAADLFGTWTLTVENFHYDSSTPLAPNSLDAFSLNFTSGMTTTGNPVRVANSTVLGTQFTPGTGGAFTSIAQNVSPVGIGPSPVIASDNTLGPYSPHEGYLYIAYVNRAPNNEAPGNPADNTDVYLSVSTDGGRTWTTNPSGSGDRQAGVPAGESGRGIRVNQDDASLDGQSQGAVPNSPNRSNDDATGRYDGRPQFEPAIAVDQTTGTLVTSYLSSEADAADARVATYVTTSIDGGSSFGPAAFANRAKTATDAITLQQVTVGPIPDNQSSGNGNTDNTFGFGIHQGLAVAAGHVYPVWSSNRNGDFNGAALLGITTADMIIASGPRVETSSGLASTMGPVQPSFAADGTPFNNSPAADGRYIVNGFLVNFDRPVDPASFTAADVAVFFHDPNSSSSFVKLNGVSSPWTGSINVQATRSNQFGTTQFLVTFTPYTDPVTGVLSPAGTYSYEVGPLTGGGPNITDRIVSFVNSAITGGPNLGNFMDQNANGVSNQTPSSAGGAGDVYAAPSPTSKTFIYDPNTFFPGPYSRDTLPIIEAGPSLTGSSVPNSPATSDNLVQDRTVSSLDVTFDRDIRVSSFTSGQVVRIMGPAGQISGQVGTFDAPFNFSSSDPKLIPINVPGNIPDAGPNNSAGELASTLTIPSASNFTLTNLTVTVSLTHPSNSDLSLFLISPAGTRVPLVAAGSLGGQNLVGTTFSDSAAAAVSSSTAPYTGTFKPAQALSAFDGQSMQGTWTLQVLDNASGNVGTLNGWSLHASEAIPDAPSAGTPGVLSSSLVIPPAADPIVVGGLTVTVNLTHPSDGSLSLFLVSPTGTRVQLLAAGTASGANFVNTTFDDTATTTINQGSAPYTARFRPAAGQSLASFAGQSLQGKWTLEVDDNTPGGVGILNGWSMSVTPAAVVVPSFRAPGGSVAIPAGSPVSSTMTLPSNGGFTIKDLAVNLDMTAANDAGLTITLSNGSQTVTLLSPNTAIGSDLKDTTFSDQGQLLVAGLRGPYSGTFRPAQALGAFSGQALQGTWTLTVTSTGGAATLNGWSLLANPSSPGAGVSARTFRVLFPRQQLSGTYTVTLGSGIVDTAGEALDTNHNAGVYALFPLADPNASGTVGVTYNSNNLNATIPQASAGNSGVLDAFLTVPDNFTIAGTTLTLNITYPNDPDLTAYLLPPGVTDPAQGILLFQQVGATGTHADFINTTFSDTGTPINNGSPPFTGTYQPGQGLGKFNGLGAGGTWTLEIRNSGTSTGTLKNWSLNFQKPVPTNGLGETVADQATASFRIFTSGATNALASSAWTAVGPAAINDFTFSPTGTAVPSLGTAHLAGRTNAIAVDPSDPSGNTVYVGAANGGIWKTTNFLTTNSNGPTYIPLTDFGPTFGINIGSIAVFGRNNDPNQSIIFAATGDPTRATKGVGVLRSMDGGSTWTLLDSSNNNLAFSSRDHLFSQNTTYAYKIVVDPTLNGNGQVNVYMALSGSAAGLYASQDSGQTWTKVLAGQATDVLLDPESGTGSGGINPISQAPTGNLQNVFAAIQGQGVFENTAQGFGTWNLVARLPGSPSVDPLIQDTEGGNPVSIPVNNGGTTPNGANGRILLAKPALVPRGTTNANVDNQIYQGWLYALVLNADGSLNGLYMTKDFGQNWTQIQIPVSAQGQPSNNESLGQVDPLNGGGPQNVSLAIDPTNPNIVYIGGQINAPAGKTGLIRVDATAVLDAHAFVPFDNSRPDGGRLQNATTGPITLVNPSIAPQNSNTNPDTSRLKEPPTLAGTFQQAAYYNLIRDPQQQFAVNATLIANNVAAFTNSGANARWIPFDIPGSTEQAALITTVDPLTGHARLILGGGTGVFTTVDNNGTFDSGVGQATNPIGDRNGNLQVTQFYYGALQPSATTLTAQLGAIFYGGPQSVGPATSTDLLGSNLGNITWSEGFNDNFIGSYTVTHVATDQTGTGTVYRFVVPSNAFGSVTNFFQVQPNGTGAFISRTSGLTTGTSDTQWGAGPQIFGGNQVLGFFAVNPIDPNQIIIGSNAGRLFRTENQGGNWSVIANPGDLVVGGAGDTTYQGALAFGAPDPAAAQGQGNHDNFIYVGTVGGHIFVTTSGGGTWTSISGGLDGSGVQQIVPDPTPGSHDAFAITQKGVYYIADSTVPTATWQSLTGNLFQNQIAPFGIASFTGPQLVNLTSLAVDWRYVVPNNPTVANSPTHPVLYVGGDGGVYRTLDNGAHWTTFPSAADGSPVDGGYLPNARVTSLQIADGKINPTTGRAVSQSGDPDVLMASTYGRGSFAIRLAPVVLSNTNTFPQPNNFLYIDPSTDTGVSSTDQYTRIRTPIVDGLSEQSAFGNTVTVNLYDHDLDPNHLSPIGTGQTDPLGRFKIQVAVPFATDGRHTIDLQATDQSGTKGNIASFIFTLKTVPPTAPGTPILDPLGDSGLAGDNTTNDNNGPNGANPAPVIDIPGNAVGSVVTMERAPLSFTSSPVAAIVPAVGVVTSTITIPASALANPGQLISDMTLDLSKLSFGAPSSLVVTLKAPDGTTVTVPTPFTNAIDLPGLVGKPVAGTYTLSITNGTNSTGTFGGWSLSTSTTSLATANSTQTTSVPANGVVTAVVVITPGMLASPDALLYGLSLNLASLSFPTPSDLTITLTGPDGTTVPVPAPFGGAIGLSGLNGKLAVGIYKLTITNAGGNSGTLGNWSLTAADAVPQTFAATQPAAYVTPRGEVTSSTTIPASALTNSAATVPGLVLDLSRLVFPTPGDLTITLTGPDGTAVPVPAPFNRDILLTGFNGKPAAGKYTLTIHNGGTRLGTLGSWSLTLAGVNTAGGSVGAGGSVSSQVTIPAASLSGPAATITDGVVLDLSSLASFPTPSDLTVTLTGPDGTTVPVSGPFGQYVFVDGLNGKPAAGNYTLTITNAGTSTGALGGWSLALPGTMTVMSTVNTQPGAATGAPPVTVKVPDTNGGNGTIADGSYLYSAFQTDQAGNVGLLGPGLVVTIQTGATIAAPPSLTHDTDTGLPRPPRDADVITNLSQPAFEGVVEPNATVQLLVNGNPAGTGQADALGHYRVTATAPLTEGINLISIVETDAASNTGVASLPLRVRLDTTPPPPIGPKLAPSSDTGLATSPGTLTDNTTKNNTPTFVGTAEVSPYLGADLTPLASGTLVQIYAQADVPAGQTNNNPIILVGEALADPLTGAYSVTVGQYVTPQGANAVTSLADGSYNITVIQTDVAGNRSLQVLFGNTGAVVIDGTDSPLHGDNNGPGRTNEQGWLYMQKVLNLIEPNITNGQKILVDLGVNPGTSGFGLVTSTMKSVFAQSNLASDGWTMVCVTGDANITAYLSGGAAQAVDINGKPAGTISMFQTGLLYITTGNKLGDDLTNAQLAILNQHGPEIKSFVNAGGGLYAQTELPSFNSGVVPFGWLTSLFPGIQPVLAGGGTNGLQITPEGHLIFPTVATSDFNGAIWHNYFTGNFGPLAVVATVPSFGVPQPVPLVLSSAGGTASGSSSLITIDTIVPQPQPPATPVLEAASDSGPPPLDNVTNFNNSGTTHPAPVFDVANVEAGAQVQLFRNGALVGTVVNGPTAGTVAIADINQSDPLLATASPPVAGPAIPDGTYTYTVQVTDVAGNVGGFSAGTTVQILATPPTTPSNLALLSASDTGTFPNDAVTSFNNSVASPSNAPLFSVSGIAANTTVKLLRNGLVVNTLNITTGGTIQIADTNNGSGTIPDGTYTYRVQQVDRAGNVSGVSLGVSVTIDSTAPAAPSKIVLDPSTDSGTFNNDGITFFNNSTPGLTPIFDVSGVEAHATLQLYRSGVLVNTLVNTAGGTVQIADTNNGNGTIADGSYTYTVLQIDLAGNTGPMISNGAPVTIAATPPTASPVRLDANSDTGISNSDGITQVTLFHFPTFDITGVTPGATVNLYRNNVVVATLTNTAGGTVQITDANTIADGTYTYKAQQIDLAGNVGAIGSPIQVTYDTVAPIAPAAPVLSPGGGNHSSVNNPSFTVSNIEAGATVKLLRDGVVVATLNNASPVGSTITITDPGPVPGGTHTFQAFQVDRAGNTSPIGPGSGGITFSPNAPTSITLDASTDSGTAGDNVTNATKPIIDIGGTTAGSTVRLIRNGNVVATLVSGGGTVQITDPGPLVSGTYVYAAQQVDASGTASPVSSTLTVTIATTVATPTLSLDPASDSGTKNDNITNVKNPTFDVGNVAAGATVELLRNGSVVATLVSAGGGTVQIADPGPVQPDGTYNYTARQTDGAGNVSSLSSTLALTINSTVPAPPTLALDPVTDSGTVGDGITSNTRPTIDILGVLPGATATLSRTSSSGTTLVKTITNTTSSTASFSFTEPAALIGGQYTYTAQQTSAAGGLSSTATLTVTIDTTLPPPAPVVTLDAASDTGTPGDGSTTTTANLVFDISNVLPGAVVTLFRNNAAVGTATGTAGGTVTITDANTLAVGTYSYTAQQVSSGGTSPVGPAFTLTIVSNSQTGPTGPVQGDYNADGKTDFALFYRQPSTSKQGVTATWFVTSYTPGNGVPFGSTKLDVPVQGDFNGDGHADIAVYRPSTAQWLIGGQPTLSYGMANVDIPVPGNYDGLGMTQVATYRPTTGQWSIGGRAQPNVINVPGYKPSANDIPAPADYNGDGKTDEAVFRPGTGQWFIAGQSKALQFGGSGFIPVPGDYDGVGHAEMALFRPATSQWYVAGSNLFNGVSFGGPGDVPAPGNYDGTGKTQITTYRPSTGQWYVAGHASPISYGGLHMVPANAPYAYRALAGTLSVKSVKASATTVSHDFGATATALSAGSTGQGTTAQAATSVFSKPPTVSRVRPNTLGLINTQTAATQFVNPRGRVHSSALKAGLPGGPARHRAGWSSSLWN